MANPDRLDDMSHNMTIYHQLMDKQSYKDGVVPSAGSMFEEAQALMFAGTDTSGATLMHGFFEILKRKSAYQRLKKELTSIWPNVNQDPPSLQKLEQLPYLTAVIKESLRLNSGVVSGLLRIVPPEGAKICDDFIPGGVSDKGAMIETKLTFPDRCVLFEYLRTLQSRHLP